MNLMFSLVLVHSSILWIPCESAYAPGTHKRMFAKMLNLHLELVKDAMVKVTAVQHYRYKMYQTTPYQVGEIYCRIRYLLAKMVTLYRRMEEGYFNDTEQYEKFLDVHGTWFEIDHLIQMIEMWEERKTIPQPIGSLLTMGWNGEASRRWQDLEEGEWRGGKLLEEFITTSSSTNRPQASHRKNKKWQVGYNNEFKNDS